ncbi:MAG: ATP-grasp domain-containing protein [Clostridiales bacterium]|nr:ATP-grasp domain-containing protein [Clostridiales bacterium]
MKKLLILGAGIYQVPLIKKAKEMGIYTIVVSIPGNYPGFKIADKIYYENTVDYEAVLQIAKEEKIDGIVTTGTDVAIITVGYVCDKLGLKGLSLKSAKIATNKLEMKKVYEDYGVTTARFRQTSFDLNEIKAAMSQLNLPLIFKAVDTSGSRGIVKFDENSDLSKCIDIVKSATKLDYFIIEEFIEGTEFGAQAFVLGGKVQFVLPHGDYVFVNDTGVPVGHFAPYDLSDEIINDTKIQVQKAVEAMQLDNCALNVDFILSDGKVYVLEVGGRCGATCLAELVSIYYGYDYYEKIINVSIGVDEDFSSNQKNPNASHLIMSEKTGKIISQNYTGSDENVLDVQFDYCPGDKVRKFSVGPDRIGHIITKGKNLEEAVEVLDKAMSNIKIEVE